jgi:hypothetical protein
MRKLDEMRIEADPEARSFVLERGGLLFVRIRRGPGVRAGGLATLEATTEPPPDALDWRRIRAGNLLVFVPAWMRLPRSMRLSLAGRSRRRIRALWNGCHSVM